MELNPKVVIFQPRLLHYRTAFFEHLREACRIDAIDLELVCGQAVGQERSKKDEADLPWVTRVHNRHVEIAGRTILWQPFPPHLRDCDLVIVMQESRIISNYPLQLLGKLRGMKVAYWGHGKNFFNKSPGGITEWWKDWLINRVDWWFAYTDIVVDIVKQSGFPENRITCLNNAIDTSGFRRDLESITDRELQLARNALHIRETSPVGIFCGSFYPDKKLDFLIESADLIYQRSPDFNLIIIGSGPSAPIIEDAASSRPWMHFIGQKRGLEKALYFRMADLMLNPGTVGLHIVDAFCAGIIMVTTADGRHSPEIAYLKDGQNGLLVEGTAGQYANAVLSLIENRLEATAMKREALAASNVYTLENMVENYRRGIRGALNI